MKAAGISAAILQTLLKQRNVHELSIAESIIELAIEEAKKRNSPAVVTIKVRLGEFTGVVREALEFSFEIARRGTLAERAVLEIEVVPLKMRCPQCGLVSRPIADFCVLCAACASPVEIISGREMQVEYLELAEAEEAVTKAVH
jgi:hydrogenase nickel incorporation protein HypA/HybF